MSGGYIRIIVETNHNFIQSFQVKRECQLKQLETVLERRLNYNPKLGQVDLETIGILSQHILATVEDCRPIKSLDFLDNQNQHLNLTIIPVKGRAIGRRSNRGSFSC